MRITWRRSWRAMVRSRGRSCVSVFDRRSVSILPGPPPATGALKYPCHLLQGALCRLEDAIDVAGLMCSGQEHVVPGMQVGSSLEGLQHEPISECEVDIAFEQHERHLDRATLLQRQPVLARLLVDARAETPAGGLHFRDAIDSLQLSKGGDRCGHG